MIGNVEHLNIFTHYPNGKVKAKLIYVLDSDECPCKFDKEPNTYVDGRNVYRRITE